MKRTDLHEYQNYCVEFLKTHREAMLILEMGLGKSAISLTAVLDDPEQIPGIIEEILNV